MWAMVELGGGVSHKFDFVVVDDIWNINRCLEVIVGSVVVVIVVIGLNFVSTEQDVFVEADQVFVQPKQLVNFNIYFR